MKIVSADIRSSASPFVEIDITFQSDRGACIMGGYIARLASAGEEVKLVPKDTICYKPGFEPTLLPVPEKIFRCGDTTTVIWVDGTKTIVKLMPGADDSDYGAFTAALAKKIYGNNSKVMRYAGMVQRVKSKAEKKSTRKLKRKYEEKINGEKEYIVSQYGEISECNNLDGLVKTTIYAESKEDARKKAYSHFARSMNVYVVQSNGDAYIECGAYLADDFGKWCASIALKDVFWTAVFALSKEEALKVLAINPAPKEGDKP